MMSNSDFEMAKSLEDLKEDMEALRLRMAFQAEWEDELAALEKSASETDPELDALIAESDSRIRRKISREMRKISTIAFVRKTLPAALHVAAILVLVFYLGLTTAVATSHSVRIGIIELISKIEDEYTTFSLQKSEVVTMVPPGWQGLCYPTVLPQGFALADYKPSHARFVNDSGSMVTYAEYSEEMKIQVDSSTDTVETLIIHGHKASLVKDREQVSICWVFEQRLCVLTGDISPEILIEIANSTIPI